MVYDVRAPHWSEVKVKPATEVPWTKEQVCQLFNRFDKNGDGNLSKAELKEAFQKLGSWCSSYRASRALRYADSNHDGVVSKQEFNDLVNYALACGYKL